MQGWCQNYLLVNGGAFGVDHRSAPAGKSTKVCLVVQHLSFSWQTFTWQISPIRAPSKMFRFRCLDYILCSLKAQESWWSHLPVMKPMKWFLAKEINKRGWPHGIVSFELIKENDHCSPTCTARLQCPAASWLSPSWIARIRLQKSFRILNLSGV